MRGSRRVDDRRVAGAADPQQRAGGVDPARGVGHAHEPEQREQLLVRERLLGHDQRERRDEHARLRRRLDVRGARPARARPCPPARRLDAPVGIAARRERAAPPPRRARARRCAPARATNASATRSSTIATDSFVHRIELSNAFESARHARRLRRRRRSRRPAPARCRARRRATGCRERYAARTTAVPPVATITSTPWSAISASISGIVGSSTTCRQPSGAPASTAARASSVHGLDARLARQRVRRDDDRVAGHQRQQDLEVDGRDRVRRRRQREHDAGRLRDRDDLRLGVDLRVDVVADGVALGDPARARLVLAPLVLGDAHAGLLDRRESEPFSVLVCRFGDRVDHPLRPLAVVGGERWWPPSARGASIMRARGAPGGSERAASTMLMPAAPPRSGGGSASAWPIATAVRSRISSTIAGPEQDPGLELQHARVERREDRPHAVLVQPAHDELRALRVVELEPHHHAVLADADEPLGIRAPGSRAARSRKRSAM